MAEELNQRPNDPTIPRQQDKNTLGKCKSDKNLLIFAQKAAKHLPENNLMSPNHLFLSDFVAIPVKIHINF